MIRSRLVSTALILAASVILIAVGVAPVHASPQPGLDAAPESLDRSTPRRTVRLFLNATRAGDFALAAYALDLREIPNEDQAVAGARLSRRLRYVLSRKQHLELASISDDPVGRRDDGLLTEKIGAIPLLGGSVPLTLTRVPLSDGDAIWVFSEETVRSIPELYDEYGPGWFGEQLPDWAHRTRFWNLALWQWIGLGVALAVAIVLSFVSAAAVIGVSVRLARQTETRWDDLLVAGVKGPLRACLALAFFGALSDSLKLPSHAETTFEKVHGSLLIAAIAWLVMRAVTAVAEAVALHMSESQDDPLVAQGIATRVRVTRRMVNALVLLLAASVALTQFDAVRRIGVSMLASAGIAGIALGFAAQKVLGNLLAGLQLSIAQPIRIGDRVFIEGQFGFVEEISLTYVIIKTWDLRRLVLPITYLVEKPFENWTRTSQQLIGIVMIYADYALPVEKVRAAFVELAKNDAAWDGEVANLVVVETTSDTVVLRCTASADAAQVFDFRCRLREELVAFLQGLESGRFLPRTRVELPESKAA